MLSFITEIIQKFGPRTAGSEAEKNAQAQIDKLFAIKGTKSVDSFHKRLGKVMWDKCGMARNANGLKEAIQEIRKIREEFWKDVLVHFFLLLQMLRVL